MKNGWSLLVASALVGAGVGIAAFLSSGEAMVPLATVPYVLATLGALAGASAFTRHDRMMWAWLAIALGTAVGGAVCALTGRPPIKSGWGSAPVADWVRQVVVAKAFVVNAASVVGLLLIAQAYRDLGARPAWYRVATLVAFAVGAAVAGPALMHSVTGGGISWTGVFSSVGDLVSITMIGPLAVSAIKMRGGKMSWPYLLLTLSTLSWLAYDATIALSGDAQVIADLVTMSLGGTFAGAAGLANRQALAA